MKNYEDFAYVIKYKDGICETYACTDAETAIERAKSYVKRYPKSVRLAVACRCAPYGSGYKYEVDDPLWIWECV